MDTLTLRSIEVQGEKKQQQTSKEHRKVTARKEKPARNDGQVCILTDEYRNVEVINNLEIIIFYEQEQINKSVWKGLRKKMDGKTLKKVKTDKLCEEFAVRKDHEWSVEKESRESFYYHNI